MGSTEIDSYRPSSKLKSPLILDSEGFEITERDICKRQKCNCKTGYEHHIAGVANPLGWDCQLVPPEKVISTTVSYMMAEPLRMVFNLFIYDRYHLNIYENLAKSHSRPEINEPL